MAAVRRTRGRNLGMPAQNPSGRTKPTGGVPGAAPSGMMKPQTPPTLPGGPSGWGGGNPKPPGMVGPQPHMQIGQQGKGTGMVKPQPTQPTSQWGAGNAFDAGSTMDQIHRNEYLNTLAVGGPREQAMNAMGYWSGGQPVQAPKGYRPPTSTYTEPGLYQAQAPNGAYAGITTVNQQGQAAYDPLGGGQGGGGRPMPGGPGGGGGGRVRPNRPNRPGGGQGGGFGGMYGGQGGGGGRPNPRGNQSQGGMPNGVQNAPQNGMPEIGQYPQFGQNPPPNFLPNTPGWEAARAGASGDLLNAQTQYNIGNQMVPATLGLQNARLDTDRAYASRDVDENLAERGLITSGIRAQDQQRKVAIPYGRQYQDLGIGAAGQYADLASQYGGANLGYNQNLFDALYGRANDAYAAQPLGMSVGQYSAPDMPSFTPTYAPSKGPRKARPNKNKKKAGGKKR